MARKKAYTIWYDPETVEIYGIDESVAFQSESPLARADVIQDILGVFTEIYNESVGDLNKWGEEYQAEIMRGEKQ
jgi:hypothetical protein|tara:strand:- start:907 stop:1131 length:225 start_codon:yes stop_codon:yes gene_type:complete